MADATFWWIAAGVLVAAELLTGTIYLLMLALGLAAGAVVAHLGAAAHWQVVAAAVVGGGSAVVWHLRRPQATSAPHAGSNRDVNLDVGETVHVDAWQPDGSATVKYRGATWSAVAAPGSLAGAPGAHRIVEVRGSQLVLQHLSA